MKNVLDEDIKKGEFSTVYLLYGEEEFLKQSYKKQLRSAIAGDDTMNLNIFTGRDIDVREIINLSETMPFFADRRLILVEDSGFFKKGQEEKDLIMWAARYLKKNGKSVSASTLEELLMRTGQDMNNIMSELDKLVAYVGDRDAVTVEDVREAVTSRTENRIFEMVDAIIAGKTEQAMNLYRDLLAMKEPPMRILFLIARQMSQLMAVKDMQQTGTDRGKIASVLKIPPFAARKLIGQAGAYTREEIVLRVQRAVELEEAVKTGSMNDRIAVELMIAGR